MYPFYHYLKNIEYSITKLLDNKKGYPMNIIEYYQKMAKKYYYISNYLLLLCFFIIIYSLVTNASILIVIISILLISSSASLLFMALYYDKKQLKIELTSKLIKENLYYIHLLNRPIIHLNIYNTAGDKYLEIKDHYNFLTHYIIPKKFFFRKWRTVYFNEAVYFSIHRNKKELIYHFNDEKFSIRGVNHFFYVNDHAYEWIEQPMLFNFELKRDNKIVLIGQKGRMKVSDATTFQNPNMPSIHFVDDLEEKEKIIIFAILVLKWSGKYS